jgi:hypothetical protein
MKKPSLKQARQELQAAWGNVAAGGMEFGKVCYEWKTKLGNDKILPLYRKLGIVPNIAEWWVEKYANSIGLRKLRKERHPHRAETDSFEGIRTRALKILSVGYKALLEKEEDSPRDLQAAKTWAYARLKGKDLEASFVEANNNAEAPTMCRT